jgi:hypothetical protein
MTKEQILTAITQAVNEGHIGNVDTGFVKTIKTINGAPLQFFVGTQAQYDALTPEQKQNLFAIITNDTTKEGINNALKTLRTDFDEFKSGILNGNVGVPKAENAIYASNLKRDWNKGEVASGTINLRNSGSGVYLFVVGVKANGSTTSIHTSVLTYNTAWWGQKQYGTSAIDTYGMYVSLYADTDGTVYVEADSTDKDDLNQTCTIIRYVKLMDL